jgi:hypothetical protein
MAADFLAACLGTGSDQAKCDAFIKDATKKACTTCLLGPQPGDDPKTVPQPVLIVVGDAVYPNVGACANLAVAAPGDCATRAGNETLCLLSTCSFCESADRAMCLDYAATHEPCKNALAGDTCDNAVKAARATADAKCGAVSGASFEDIYAQMAAFICGTP